MSAPNRFANTKASLWTLHDAPLETLQRPGSFDEHQHLAFEYLARAQFLFSTLVKDYPDHMISSPLRTLVKDVIQDIPLEIQSIQPYMTKLLYKMVYTARVNPVKVVECVNPGAPTSSPILAKRDSGSGTQPEFEIIEQLHIPESNHLPHGSDGQPEPFTLTQKKPNSRARPLINLPFIVKFTPDPSITERTPRPVSIQVGIPERHKATTTATTATAASIIKRGVTRTNGEAPVNLDDKSAPSSTSTSTSTRPPDAPSSSSSSSSLHSRSTSQIWKNPEWQDLIRNLPHLRYTLTPPPPESDSESKSESELASMMAIPLNPDVLPVLGTRRALKRENAFYGPSNPKIFWDTKSWGPIPIPKPQLSPVSGDNSNSNLETSTRAETQIPNSRARSMGSRSLNFGSNFRIGILGGEENRDEDEDEDEMDEGQALPPSEVILPLGEGVGTEQGDATTTATVEGGKDGDQAGRVADSDSMLQGVVCTPESELVSGGAPLTSIRGSESSPKEIPSSSSSPGSTNLRGTLRRGLKVAYKAFGLGLEGKKSL